MSAPRRARTVLAVLAATALAAAALALPGTVLGARPATPQEQAQVAAATSTQVPCVDATVSTVDPDWLDARSTQADGCPQTPAVTVAHRSGGVLQIVRTAPDLGVCPVAGVPDPVALDLDLCVADSGRVYLARPVSRTTTVYTIRPVKIWARDDAYVKALRHWKGWGTKTATARGRLDYHAGQRFHADVRLTLSRVRLCGTNKRTYTRIRTTFVHAADHRRHAFLEGTRTYACPIQ